VYLYNIYFLLKGVYNFYFYTSKFKSTNYKDFMGNISQSNKIVILENELSKANQIIEQQKLIINKLEIELNNNNDIITNLNNDINNYKKSIMDKDIELNNLQAQINNNNINIQNNQNFNDIMSVNFISSDNKIHCAVSCLKTNIFAEVEEKLYRQFPKYRETNNNFIVNDIQVLRFKTIAENKINNGLSITLIVPS